MASTAPTPSPFVHTGARLKAWRDYAELSISEAARRSGLHRQAWHRYEWGKAEPSVARLAWMAEQAFGVDLAAFFAGPPGY